MGFPASGEIKCQKCRHILIEDLSIVCNDKATCDPQKCNSYNLNSFIFLADDNLPDWITGRVVEETWVKGKLLCERCGCKVGSFDFVSGKLCDCKESMLPSVHLVTSQVDIPIHTSVEDLVRLLR